MPEEQQSGRDDGSDFKVENESKENWGAPDSQFDRDGFVRTESEREEERLGKFVAGVVEAEAADVDNSKQLSALTSTRRNLDEISRGQEDAFVKRATFYDAVEVQRQDTPVWERYENALEAFGDNPTPEEREELNKLEREYKWRDSLSSEKWSYFDGTGFDEELKAALEQSTSVENSMNQEVHEFLDLNREGLAGLSVEAFIDLTDRRDSLKDKIMRAENIEAKYEELLDRVKAKIDKHEKPYPVRIREAEFEGADDVTNEIYHYFLFGVKSGIDKDRDAIGKSVDEMRKTLEDSFTVSPQHYLERCAEIAASIKSRIEASRLKLEQALEAFDEQIKAGNFTQKGDESLGQGTEKPTEDAA